MKNEITKIGLLKEAKNKGYKYDPITGVVTGMYGKNITSFNNGGYYFMLRIAGKSFMINCDKYAWFYMFGTEPTHIKHINGIKTDNRLDNLIQSDLTDNFLITEIPDIEAVECFKAIKKEFGFDGEFMIKIIYKIMNDNKTLENRVKSLEEEVVQVTKDLIVKEDELETIYRLSRAKQLEKLSVQN